MYTCRAALLTVAQSGGFQPAVLGALTLAKTMLFFSLSLGQTSVEYKCQLVRSDLLTLAKGETLVNCMNAN